jgi:hypothetical protein
LIDGFLFFTFLHFSLTHSSESVNHQGPRTKEDKEEVILRESQSEVAEFVAGGGRRRNSTSWFFFCLLLLPFVGEQKKRKEKQ